MSLPMNSTVREKEKKLKKNGKEKKKNYSVICSGVVDDFGGKSKICLFFFSLESEMCEDAMYEGIYDSA